MRIRRRIRFNLKSIREVVFWKISSISRWTNSDGNVYMPNAYVNGANRNFNLNDFRNQLNSNYGVLVLG